MRRKKRSSEHWREQAEEWVGSKEEKEFRAHFGLPSDAVAWLWDLISPNAAKRGYSGYYFLWSLFFLKTSGSSWSVLKSRFGVKDERTFKKWLWYTLKLIDEVLPQFNFEDRFIAWAFPVPSFVDTTTVLIEEPYEYSRGCYQAGVKGTTIKYQLVCSIGVP
ncbi:hypothetical protein QOT17_007879 [Balamuthia mandrillaris]